MKNVFKKSILALVTLMFAFSCSQENEVSPINDEMELSALISDHLNSLAEGLRANNQTFSNTELVTQLGKENLKANYGINSDAVNSYSQAFKNVNLQNARTAGDLNLSGEANQFLGLIQESSTSSKHLKAYKENLITIEEDIIVSELSDEEKTILQVQIISLRTSLTFVVANFDLFHPEAISNGRTSGCDDGCTDEKKISEENESWWDSWGKCAAGIVGGAGLGALNGWYVPAVGCTVVLPVVGTVACGAAGAVVGGVFGGLLGAAEGC